MKARLIYNPNAQGVDTITPEVLIEALYEAGFDPVYQATSCEEDLDHILSGDLENLIVVAGGDGTLRAVATRVLHQAVAISLVPLGTANNVANDLEIEDDPLEIIAALPSPRKVHFDAGRVSGPWGKTYFLEGVGCGFFADAFAEFGANGEKSVMRAITSTLKTWGDYQSYQCRMWLDGQLISGNYLLVEILNTKAVGPHLNFAPDANPRDGLLNLVCIEENSRDSFFDYLSNLVQEELAQLPSVTTAQGRKVELMWSGFTLRIDGKIYHSPEHTQKENPSPADRDANEPKVIIEVIPQALEFWLPSSEKSRS